MDYQLGLLHDPRKLGIILIYETLRKLTTQMVESVIQDFHLDAFTEKELRDDILGREILHFMAPSNPEEEREAMEWMCDVRKRQKRFSSIH